MHLFPLCDFDGDHVAESHCACRPVAQITHDGTTLWLHRPIGVAEFDEADLLKQAEAINDATSVDLWTSAEKKKLAIKIIPFQNTDPIRLPKASSRKK